MIFMAGDWEIEYCNINQSWHCTHVEAKSLVTTIANKWSELEVTAGIWSRIKESKVSSMVSGEIKHEDMGSILNLSNACAQGECQSQWEGDICCSGENLCWRHLPWWIVHLSGFCSVNSETNPWQSFLHYCSSSYDSLGWKVGRPSGAIKDGKSNEGINMGLKDGSAIKSTSFSCKGPGWFPDPTQWLNCLYLLAPGDLTPFSGLFPGFLHTCHTHKFM